MLERAQDDPKIKWVTNAEVVEVLGEGPVGGLRLRDTQTGEERVLDVNGLLVAIAHDPRSALVCGQVTTDRDGDVPVEAPTTRTCVESVAATANTGCTGIDRQRSRSGPGSGGLRLPRRERQRSDGASSGPPGPGIVALPPGRTVPGLADRLRCAPGSGRHERQLVGCQFVVVGVEQGDPDCSAALGRPSQGRRAGRAGAVFVAPLLE